MLHFSNPRYTEYGLWKISVLGNCNNEIGFITYIFNKYPNINTAYISKSKVNSQYNGMGIAEKLLNHFKNLCMDTPEITSIEAYIAPIDPLDKSISLSRLINLYVKSGFTITYDEKRPYEAYGRIFL